MTEYCQGLQHAIDFEPSATVEDTISRYMTYRWQSIGVTPLQTFVEQVAPLRPEGII
jgi:hypothetical protein